MTLKHPGLRVPVPLNASCCLPVLCCLGSNALHQLRAAPELTEQQLQAEAVPHTQTNYFVA